jgi:predicted RNA-binding Zn ribbon-like protein
MIFIKKFFYSSFLITELFLLFIFSNFSLAENLPTTVLKGEIISITGNRWVPVRSEPNQASRFTCPAGLSKKNCKNIESINSNIPLTLTGERIFDADNKNWYIEATFKNKGQTITGWFDEKQTSLDTKEALVRDQTARRIQDLWDSQSEISTSGIEDYKLDMSPEAIQQRTTESEKAKKYFEAEAAKQNKKAGIAKNMFMESRGLLRMHNTRKASCGSYDYSEEGGLESYAAPITACMVTKLAETWRKKFCPKNTPCGLEFGDISHETDRLFDGHKSHTDGHCIDIRPIRNKKPENSSPTNPSVNRLTYSADNFDRAKTELLLKHLAALGGTNIIFNDPKLIKKGLSRKVKGHNDHIHVCFEPDDENVQKQCANYEPDAKMCYTSKILFDHPLMQEMKNNLKATLAGQE